MTQEERELLFAMSKPIMGIADQDPLDPSAREDDIRRLEEHNLDGVKAGRKLFRIAEKILESGEG